MQKNIFISIIMVFLVGFLVGRLSANKINNKQEVSINNQTSTKKTNEINVAETKKDSNLSQQTNYIEKYYNPKGKLTKEVIFGNHIDASVRNTMQNTKTVSQDFATTSTIETKTITNYQPNWMGLIQYSIGPNSSFKSFDYSKLQFGLSYRVISNIYASIITNTKFDQYEIQASFPLSL